MSKKDYTKIAEEFYFSKPIKVDQSEEYYFGQLATWENHVMRFTSMLAAENPRFNRDRFLTACGYNS